MTDSPVTIVQACLRDGGGGSPTAIVAEPTWPADADRRQVPLLAGVSHAVFVDAESGGDAVALRFFTAEGELPACGHGTVAALAYLIERTGEPEYRAVLRTAGGREIRGRARRRGDLVTAGFEAGRIGLREPTAEELADVAFALGSPARTLASDVRVATLGRPRMLVPVTSRSVLGALRPDLRALRSACLRHGLLGCYVYTKPAEGRCAARMFAPAIGVPEDIANANSTACLAARLHAAEPGHPGITVDMGDSLDSPATITATVLDSAPGADSLVQVGGAATTGRTVLLETGGA
ncbi:PhzF family isomerase [Actinoallomurus acanthiterrae]